MVDREYRFVAAPQDRAALEELLHPRAVRERCARVLEHVASGESEHLRYHPDALPRCADHVAAVIRARFPVLDIPLHSRWRHFEVGGVDRWSPLLEAAALDREDRARTEIDLAVTSVLLDAGAGAEWRYRDPCTGETYQRSEGLALASLHAFGAGLFSSRPGQPLRADAAALAGLEPARLAAAFQLGADNRLVGFEGRIALLRRLGATLAAGGHGRRVGDLYDLWAAGGSVSAPAILVTLLRELAEVWPSRLRLAGVNLGDVWWHHALTRPDPSDRLVPFHKLSQWLTFSLVEVLERAGITVREIDGLTGLAEYRNGGLLVDLGVLEARDPDARRRRHRVDDTLIVEWRACTVALLDALAPLVRTRLGPGAQRLRLVELLEGGTWYAGRALAAERRPGGRPPFEVEADGTVF